MNKLEAIILRSILEYEALKDEALDILNENFFTGLNKVFFKILSSLHPFSFEAFTYTLTENQKKSPEYENLCLAVPDIEFLSLIPLLKNEILLKNQKALAKKLELASNDGVLLDLSVFENNFFTKNSFKTYVEWEKEFENKPLSVCVPSGINFIDNALEGGFNLGQLVLISGDPEAGKTTLGIQILENMSKRRKVAFFCFEFTIWQYLDRKAKLQTPVNKDNMYIINDNYDINDLILAIKEFKKKWVNIILIDSQMRITSPRARNMEEEESFKFSSLAKLAHSHNLLIFLIIQTAKGDRDNPMGSKKGTHEASIILRIELLPPDKNDPLQSSKEFHPSQRLFLIRKNKQTGKHFKEKIYFDEKKARFSALIKADNFESVTFNQVQKELNL